MTSLLAALAAYIPRDRVAHIVADKKRPFSSNGIAMIADISGFTPLTEALTTGLSAGHGAEELTRALDSVFDPLIQQVHAYRGSVIKFGGDALIVWFGEEQTEGGVNDARAQVILRALTVAQKMQQVMIDYGQIPTPIGPVTLKMKIGLTYGPVKRFNLGLPEYGYEDIIAGATLDRMADAEHHAEPGDIIADKATLKTVRPIAPVTEWRQGFGVVGQLAQTAPPASWPELTWLPEQEASIVKALADYVPRPIYEMLLAKQAHVAELKPVVSLFVQFHGLDYDADPDIATKLQTYFVMAQRVVARYNGRLNRLITGDKGSLLHIIFGAPRTVEEQEARAVRCALDLQAECSQLPFITMQRIGITVGRCFAGPVGGSVRHDYTTMGDSINLSARLMQNAADDQTLLEKAVREQLDEQFSIADLGTILVKGKSQPIPIFAAMAVQSARQRQQTTTSERMFGRELETAVNRQQLAALPQGIGGIVTIVGEVGMGKTLLLNTLRREWQATQSGSMWSGANCLAYGQTISGYLLIDLIRGLLALPFDAGPDQTSQYLLEFCVDLFGSARLESTYPYLATFMGLPLTGDYARRLEGLSGESVRWQLLTLLPDLFRHLAQRQPVVLALDDIQWADPTSRQLLASILPVTKDVPLLVLLAMRPEGEAFEGSESHRIELNALTTAVAGDLVRHHAPDWPERVVAKLVSRSGGNPLFLMEMVRTLRLQGPVDDSLDFDEIALPTTIDGLILAQFDRLTVEARHTLQVASVIGQTFLDKVLTAVATAEEKIENQLTELVHGDYIHPANLDLGAAHSFRHQLIQDSAYSTLLHERRRQYHRAVAETLEHFFPGEILEQASLLAYHHERAANTEKAIAYYLQVADQSRLIYANEEAETLYHKVLALLAQQPALDQQQQARTFLKLAQVRANTQDFTGAQKFYEQAFILLEQAHLDEIKNKRDEQRPFRWGILPDYARNFDPAYAEAVETADIVMNLFEGLVEFDNEWNIIPALALRWTVSDDGRRYRFVLRDDLCWSDGEPLTAHDFVFAWHRNLDPKDGSPLAYYLYVVEGAEAYHSGDLDDVTRVGITAVTNTILEINLQTPITYFPYLLADPITFPQPSHIIKQEETAWGQPTNLVSNGAFQVQEVTSKQIKLSPNKYYRGWQFGNVASVTLQLIEPTLAHYEAGKIDYCRVDDQPELLRRFPEETYIYQAFLTFILGFSCQNAPFDKREIRQAFAYCVDQAQLVKEVWNDVQKPAFGGVVPPGMSGHSPEIGLPYNPERAQQLFTENHESELGETKLVLGALNGFKTTPQFLQNAWENILGIEVEVKPDMEIDNLLEALEAGTVHCALIGYNSALPDPDELLRGSFYSDSPTNDFVWQNELFDQLVDQAVINPNPHQRLSYYHQADQLVTASETAIVPLYYLRSYGLLRSPFQMSQKGRVIQGCIKFKNLDIR